MNDFEEIDGDSLICPYCKSEESDMWEERANDGQKTCYDCGKKFNWERRTDVEYITKCNCEDNGEEHDYDESNNWSINSGNTEEEIKLCDCKRCSHYKVLRRKKEGA